MSDEHIDAGQKGQKKGFLPMIRSIIAATIALTLSVHAVAGKSITAKLEAPTDRTIKIVAAKALWKCVDDTCTATLDRPNVRISTCQQVVKSLGRVSAFSSDQKTLSPSKLEKCNAAVKS